MCLYIVREEVGQVVTARATRDNQKKDERWIQGEQRTSQGSTLTS